MRVTTNINFPCEGHTYKLIILDNSTCHGCQSLKAKFKVSELRNERVCRMKKYPIVLWTNEDFDFLSMLKLIENVSKN